MLFDYGLVGGILLIALMASAFVRTPEPTFALALAISMFTVQAAAPPLVVLRADRRVCLVAHAVVAAAGSGPVHPHGECWTPPLDPREPSVSSLDHPIACIYPNLKKRTFHA